MLGALRRVLSINHASTTDRKIERLVAGGEDLNHRLLGYEFKGKLIPDNLHAHG